MKKIAVVLLLVVAVGGFGQTSKNPILGYEKLAWGASIQDTKALYQNLTERESNEAYVGVREFRQSYSTQEELTRTFYFFKEKLFKVTTAYDTLGDVNATARKLRNEMTNMYGQATRQNSSGGGVDKYFINEMYSIWELDNKLEVEIRWGNTLAYDYVVGIFVITLYTNPEIEYDIEVSKVRSRQNNGREFTAP